MKDKMEELRKQFEIEWCRLPFSIADDNVSRNRIFNWFVDKSSQLEPLAKPIIVDRKMVAHIANGVISLQKTDYIEDGAIIEINGGKIKLYEIPLYGGCPQLIGEYKTIIEAIAKSDELT